MSLKDKIRIQDELNRYKKYRKKALIRSNALKKLTDEEKDALGLNKHKHTFCLFR